MTGQRQRIRRGILGATLVFLFAGAAGAPTPIAHAAVPQPGEYLEENYMAAVRKSGSPWKADQAVEPGLRLAQLAMSPDGIVTISVGNFHEGACAIRIGKSGETEWLYSDRVGTAQRRKPAIQFAADGRVRVGCENETPRWFRFVGSASDWSAYQALSGTWRDANGLGVDFRKDGAASADGRKAHYGVCLDMVFCGQDILIVDDVAYAFERQQDSLTVYRTRELDWGYEVLREDFRVFHRVREAP